MLMIKMPQFVWAFLVLFVFKGGNSLYPNIWDQCLDEYVRHAMGKMLCFLDDICSQSSHANEAGSPHQSPSYTSAKGAD